MLSEPLYHLDKNIKAVVTLTTVPARLSFDHEDGVIAVVRSLCEQKYSDYEVHFNIPLIYPVTGEEYIIPDWLVEFESKYKHLKVFRTTDYAAATKFIPTLLRINNPDTIIIITDDDLIYREEMVSEHMKYQSQLDGIIGYDGRGRTPKYHDLRDAWIVCTSEIVKTTSLQHYKTISYKRKTIEQDFFDLFLHKTHNDDIMLWYYSLYKSITQYVVPYEPELYLYDTKEKWETNQGVTSFPVIRHANALGNTGCNHPSIDKWFVPPEFVELTKDKHPIL